MTMTTSALSAAMRPISGRLPRSRSPPQPKTQKSLPLRERAQGIEHMRQRIGLVSIVDDAEAPSTSPTLSSRPDTPLRTCNPSSTFFAHGLRLRRPARGPAASRAFSTWNAPSSGKARVDTVLPNASTFSAWPKPSGRASTRAASISPVAAGCEQASVRDRRIPSQKDIRIRPVRIDDSRSIRRQQRVEEAQLCRRIGFGRCRDNRDDRVQDW